MNKENHLPVFGVGPFYGIAITLMAIAGIILSVTGVLDSGKLVVLWQKISFILAGILLIALGIAIWVPAALGKKNIDKYIVENKLCTTGIYSIVRNPCYSGIAFALSGILFIFCNLWLLILPFVFWLFMTILMKLTEEKWLTSLYGKEYTDYLKRVNRCIPWFPKK